MSYGLTKRERVFAIYDYVEAGGDAQDVVATIIHALIGGITVDEFERYYDEAHDERTHNNG